MTRTLIGAGIGSACAMLLLTGYGAWGGYFHGGEWFAASRNLTAWEAAAIGALHAAVFFWWTAVPVGGLIGGVAGLGSWLVRPRPTTGTPRRSRPSSSVTGPSPSPVGESFGSSTP